MLEPRQYCTDKEKDAASPALVSGGALYSSGLALLLLAGFL